VNKRLFLVTILVAVALAAGIACGDDGDETGTATPSPTQSEAAGTPTLGPTETAGPTPTATEQPFAGAREPVEGADPQVPPVAVQTDVRHGAHSDYDRVVFDFLDNHPGYLIEYVDPPILADGSGLEVEIEGEAFLQVRFSTAQAHDEAGNLTIDEDKLEIMPGLTSILEIERTGDFEGYVTWVLGLPEELDFRVYDLDDPIRVVVDVGHP
jgi:hypothetical protein